MDKKFNLISYIKQNYSHDPELFDMMNYSIKSHIYNNGEYFNKNSKIISIWRQIVINFLTYIYLIYVSKRNKSETGKKILSSSYFNYDSALRDLGFNVQRAAYSLKRGANTLLDYKLYFLTKKIQRLMSSKDFRYLCSKEFSLLLVEYKRRFKETVVNSNFDALVVANDIGFFERVSIAVFKELGKPSFLYAHGGMPNIFDGIMDNRTDYIVMWGTKQVEAYVKEGFNADKFFTSGHPFYKKTPSSFRFGLENILVLTKSLNGVCPLEEVHLEDPANSILYLYTIQNTLQKLGMKSVRLRPHPSENPLWFKKYIDTDFFQIDTSSLSESLEKSSLVIGPASTTIIDSLANGVNYLVYEPTINNRTMMGYRVSPPMDDSDPRFPIARNEEELSLFLTEKKGVEFAAFKEFIGEEFNLSFMTNLV